MSLKFMSDEWFDKVEELKNAAGDLDVPVALHDLVLNVVVTDTEWGDRELCLNAGNLEKGHHQNAPTKLTLPVDLAHSPHQRWCEPDRYRHKASTWQSPLTP